MLCETKDWKELSTSTEVEGEDPEEGMVRHAQGNPTRKDTQSVSSLVLFLDFHVT